MRPTLQACTARHLASLLCKSVLWHAQVSHPEKMDSLCFCWKLISTVSLSCLYFMCSCQAIMLFLCLPTIMCCRRLLAAFLFLPSIGVKALLQYSYNISLVARLEIENGSYPSVKTSQNVCQLESFTPGSCLSSLSTFVPVHQLLRNWKFWHRYLPLFEWQSVSLRAVCDFIPLAKDSVKWDTEYLNSGSKVCISPGFEGDCLLSSGYTCC